MSIRQNTFNSTDGMSCSHVMQSWALRWDVMVNLKGLKGIHSLATTPVSAGLVLRRASHGAEIPRDKLMGEITPRRLPERREWGRGATLIDSTAITGGHRLSVLPAGVT